MKRLGGLLIGAMGLLLLASCVSATTPALPKPPPVKELPTTTTIADFSGTSIPRVAGTTTTVGIQMIGGNASFKGRVTLGGAPVPGATVRVERFVGGLSTSKDVIAKPDGTYEIGNLLGGRYRIRGFRPPDAAMTQAQVVFVSSSESKSLDLALEQFSGGVIVSAGIAPDPPELGAQANVVVQISSKGVDSSGVARSIPSPGVVLTLSTAGGRALVTPNPVVTDVNGRATWTVNCVALEYQALAVTLPDGSQYPLTLSACRLPPTTTTTVPVDALTPIA